MNAEQKQRAIASLTKFWAADSNKAVLSTGYEMAGVLQELIDAPERDPELVRDAERYRWLRTYNTAKHPSVTEAFFLGDENLDAEIDAAIAAEKAPHDHRHTTTARAGNESVIGGLEMTTAPKNARYWQRRALRAEAELNLLRQRLGRDLDVYRDHVSELIDLRFRVREAIDTLKGIEQ